MGQHRGKTSGSRTNDHKQRLIDQALEETFPASDAPSWCVGDEPPINAEAKWEAVRAAKKASKRHH